MSIFWVNLIMVAICPHAIIGVNLYDLVGETIAQAFGTPPLVLHGVVSSHDVEAMCKCGKIYM
jgi:hypothetical protein